MRRYSICSDLLFQYRDGLTSFRPNYFTFLLNMKNGSVSCTTSPQKGKKLKSDFFESDLFCNKEIAVKIAQHLDKLSSGIDSRYHLSVNAYFRNCRMVFDDARISFYEHSIGRIALCNNGKVLYYDFGITNNIEELYSELTYLYNMLLQDVQYRCTINKKLCEDCQPDVLLFKPRAASFLIHEVVGHALEMDNYEQVKKHIENNQKNFLPHFCNITDNPISSDYLRYGKLDDAGQEVKTASVVVNGEITSTINTLRSSDYNVRPLIRMSNLILENNDNGRNAQEIIRNYKHCTIVEEISSGGLNPQTGEFFISCSKRESQGSSGDSERLSPCIYYGKITMLKDLIIEIGNDSASSVLVCSKEGQTIFVGSGSPSIVLLPLQCIIT